mmetsp:Transcript_110545/g.323430  ORF Transcript_110545/g.323430 Transcript_110545/m.323430 type:complete len:571 (+) Transcript_110545:61-1773(+)
MADTATEQGPMLKRPASALVNCKVAGKAPPAPVGDYPPPASLAEFFQFLQCQLRMEARQVMYEEMDLEDQGALAMWADYEKFVTPNLGLSERWVPYHTAFGVHEFFLIESVHHRCAPGWNEKRRFMSIFVFRAHCKKDLFTEAQLPYLLTEDFWRDPVKAFRPGGQIERTMLHYRRTTKRPLLTLCFRMIPERLLKDDDENLVRSIILRTQRLLEVAEKAWPVIKDPKMRPEDKFNEISALVQNANGLGETWAKMITVCLDLAYPKQGLLESQCEVGIGALAPLRCLLPNGGPENPREALKELTRAVNCSVGPSAQHFWKFLPEVEKVARRKFKRLPLIMEQVKTRATKMSAVTLQVQLCEYRQFRNGMARIRFNLPGDETMKLPEKEKRVKPEDYMHYDEQLKKFTFKVQVEGREPIPFEVSQFGTRNSRPLAERVAATCFEKLRNGVSKKDVEDFRTEMYRQCQLLRVKDVPDRSIAWQKCKGSLTNPARAVSFTYEYKNCRKVCFQTTSGATGGSVLEAERIARLCYRKFESGAWKEDVIAYRDKLYQDFIPSGPSAESSAKRRRTY